VLIETLPAAFEMDEILFELRERSSGLNCGRWDYIFSFIKKHRASPTMALPDRKTITMEQHFLRSYAELLVQTCHRRGAHAMGGMAAQIPIKNDAARNQAALDKVRADKQREVRAGHDGTWVAHPGLVPIAREAFDTLGAPNQLDNLRSDVRVSAADLLREPEGLRTEEGARENVRVGVQYLEAWLRGQGCVPLYDLMEDAATAEISRAQLWQWRRREASITLTRGGTAPLDETHLRHLVDDELGRLARAPGAASERSTLAAARELFDQLVEAESFEDFLTLPASERVRTPG
jgi:malate synthase